MGSPQHYILRNQPLAIGIAALSCSLCYLLGVMLPVAGALFVYAAPLPLFVMALSFGFRPLALSSLVAVMGISCVGSVALSLHFILSIVAAVMWYGYVRSSDKVAPSPKILMGWVFIGIISIALNTGDKDFIESLTKAVDIFYSTQLSKSQFADLTIQKEDLLQAIRVMPALLSILWLGALSLTLIAANWVVRNPLGLKKVKELKLYASLPDGCFYLILVSVLGCMLSDPDAKLFFVNALVFSLFPFISLGNDHIINWMKSLPSARFWLIAFYVLCFLMMWPLLLMAFIGIGRFLQTYTLPFKHHKMTNS